MKPAATSFKRIITYRYTVRVISVLALALGLIFVGSSASARFAVQKFVNKALTVVRGSARPKPAPSKRSSNVTNKFSNPA